MAPTTVPASPELDNAPAWALCLPTSVPFPPKLCGMLQFAEQMGHDDVVSWLPHGRAFRIHDPDGFMRRVASRFLTAKKLRSVHRQLLCWGFQRIDKGEDKDAWFHKFFVRGQPALMKNMIRTKIKGKVPPASAMPDFLPFLDGTKKTPMPNFLTHLDGGFEHAQKPAVQPMPVTSLSQEPSSRSSGSFAGNLHQGTIAQSNLPRTVSWPDSIPEPAGQAIEPLPFRGNHNIVPFNDGEVSLLVDQMIHDPYDEFSLFIDWTIHDPDANKD